MIKNLKQLVSAINKDLPLTFYFPGNEYYNKNHAISLIKKKVLGEIDESLSFLKMYGEDFDFEIFLDFAESYSFSGSKKLIILYGLNKLNATGQKRILKYLTNPSPNTHVIFETPAYNDNNNKINLNTKFYKQLQKSCLYYFFWPPFDNDIIYHIQSKIKQSGKIIESEAVRFIKLVSNNDLHLIDNEINKLLIYAGDQRSISLDDVRESFGVTKEFSIFDLIDYMFEGKFANVFNVLEKGFDYTKEANVFLWNISRQLFQLLELQLLKHKGTPVKEIIKEIGVFDKYYEKYNIQSQKLGEAKLNQLIKLVTKSEKQLKSSSLDNQTIITNLVLGFMQITQR